MKYTLNILSIFCFVIVIVSVLSITSCKNNKILGPDNLDEDYSKVDSMTIQLEQIKILFPTVEQWEEKGATVYSKDSAVIIDKNGEILLDKTFTINSDAAKSLEVEQQLETILTIITNGDNVDLTKLNTYRSPWKKIELSSSNKYNKKAYTSEEIKVFPPTSIQEVLDYIFLQTRTTQSEFDWTKYLKQAKTIYEFPFDIKVSKITLRFKGEYQDGSKFEKYIVFKLI